MPAIKKALKRIAEQEGEVTADEHGELARVVELAVKLGVNRLLLDVVALRHKRLLLVEEPRQTISSVAWMGRERTTSPREFKTRRQFHLEEIWGI
jgi:hypothetical protein